MDPNLQDKHRRDEWLATFGVLIGLSLTSPGFLTVDSDGVRTNRERLLQPGYAATSAYHTARDFAREHLCSPKFREFLNGMKPHAELTK